MTSAFITRVAALAGTLLLAASVSSVQETAPEIPPSKRRAARAKVVHERIKVIFDQLEQDGDFRAAKRAVDRLRDRVIIRAPLDEPDLFREAGLAWRTVRHVAVADARSRVELFRFLRKSRKLQAAVAFAIRPGDHAARAYGVVDRLRLKHGDPLERYANLVAALAVVHDTRSGSANDRPIDLFEYYVRHEGQMLMGIRHIPPALLVHVVDTPAGIADLEWALDKYAGDSNVGNLYFAVPYDEMHHYGGKKKRISGKPYTLENLRKYGGVCHDQAYFASNVGKAIGVPAVSAGGHAGDQGHAWVGFFEVRGRNKGRWNFLFGRYEEYRWVRGWVKDPQTGRQVPESHVALRSELVGTRPSGRHQAVALTDAAARLGWMHHRKQQAEALPPLLPTAARPVRGTDTATRLALIEAALRKNPAHEEGWQAVAALARSGKLGPDQIREWAGYLGKLCGKTYPDFSADILKPLIASIKNVENQNRAWEKAIRFFKRRHDLAAELRMEQAAMWAKARRPDRAMACYRIVLDKHANDGPVIVTALGRAGRLLRDHHKADRIPALYAETWARIRMPRAANNKRASNWYRVGMAYLKILEEFKDRQRAGHVRKRLRKVAG
jgi:hypothetical protein